MNANETSVVTFDVKRTAFRAFLALVIMVLVVVLTNTPTTAQGVVAGRWSPDTGTPIYGFGSATDTTAQTMAAAPGALNSNYVYWASRTNTSAATVTAALIKSGTTSLTVIPCPAASAYNPPTVFRIPLRGKINSAVTMEATA